MSMWGAGLFQDDLATGFVAEIVRPEGLAALERALADARQTSGHLLYEAAIRALIAAEALAALGGRPATPLPTELADWAAHSRNDAIPEAWWALASGAVERVKEDSELAELWARSEELARWVGKVDDLLARLAA
jgi:hypothetical protein